MRFLSFLTTLIFAVFLSACGGGGGSAGSSSGAQPITLFTTAPASLNLNPGEAGTYQVSGGTPPYVASSGNSAVVSAVISGSSLSVVGLASGGPANVVISDAKGVNLTVAVTVSAPAVLSSTAPPAVTVASGQIGSYTISGGVPPYVVTSSNQSVATASVVGSALTINGVRNGSASVVINDSKGATPVTIAVTVAAPVALATTAPSVLTMGVGVSNSFLISGGTAPYAAVSSNATFVSASATGNVLSILALASGGPVPVEISDAQGAKLSINVTVAAAGALLTTAPPAITVANGQVNSFSVSGGVPPYIVTSSNQSVAIATVSGSFLSISGVGAGGASVVVNDSKGSAPVTIAVTVPAPNALYTTAPAAITIAPGQAASYLVSGGFPPYSVSSSNASVSSVNINGSVLTISGNTAGSANIVVVDSKGTNVQISVAVGSSTAFYVNAPSAISLGVGTSANFGVGGGVQPYSVSSSDARVAIGSISGSTLTITPLKAGTATIQVFDGTGKSISITVTVDGASSASAVASIEMLSSAASLPSAAGSTVTFLVTVKDASNNTVPGQTVTFVASSGNLVVNPSPAVTGANGTIASVSLSPGADASNRVITVTASAGGIAKTVSIPVVGTTVAVSGPGSTLTGTSGLVYSLRASDSAGKAISGAVLTMSSVLGNPLNPQTVVTNIAGTGAITYSATNAGTDTLTVSGLGTSGKTTVLVGSDDFVFVLPAVNSNLPVGVSTAVKVRYRLNGVGIAGQIVNFSSSRGVVSPASAVTDANGEATVQVSSTTAGPASLSAQVGTARTNLALSFVALTPNSIFLQASPSTVLPNALGSSTNQSALTAKVIDSYGNAIAGQVVNFTAISDLSGGSITPASVTTDISGVASAQFVSGAQSTPANGVVLSATVQGTSVTSTTSLTVSGSALFINIGMSNDLTVVDRNTYAKSFSVYVTDVNGAPVANRAITLSVYPTSYGKGFLVYDSLKSLWVYSVTSPTVCANEDVNRNGILDAGEDTNGNGLLTPGMPVILSPAALTTDSNGYSTFLLNYGKNFAYWLDTQITAKASVAGTESSYTRNYSLVMTSDDAASPSSPSNQTSPFGTGTVCTNPN